MIHNPIHTARALVHTYVQTLTKAGHVPHNAKVTTMSLSCHVSLLPALVQSLSGLDPIFALLADDAHMHCLPLPQVSLRCLEAGLVPAHIAARKFFA